MTSPRSPYTKSVWIDSVTEHGEILTAKDIVARINERFSQDMNGCEMSPRNIGGIIPNYLGHKFRRHHTKGKASKWEKIQL